MYKKALRRLSCRISRVVLNVTRVYKLRALLATSAKKDLPLFDPPVPEMADGVKAMNEPEFQAYLAKCFEREGLIHSTRRQRQRSPSFSHLPTWLPTRQYDQASDQGHESG